MRDLRTRVLVLVSILLAFTASVVSGDVESDNGIHVAEAKLFDARALFLMMEELEGQLERLSVVDQQKIAAALGQLQGQQVRELAVSGRLGSTPTPGSTRALTLDDDSGELVASSGTESSAEFTPQISALPAPVTAPTTSLGFGVQAQDLLSDQVNLTYQIFSLRLLLERALSDRLLKNGDEGEPRQQAILGFRVNVDPPREAKKKAAFVEITIVPKGCTSCGSYRPSVVALMPQEKTYNATSVSTEAGSFGGAALAGVFSLGANVRKSSQVFFLYRDSDTISFPRLETPPGFPNSAVTFGWQFRPVLGRKSVSAEPRQLMAVLALPQNDLDTGSSSPTAGELELEVHVRTYWRKYHSKSQTTKRIAKLERGPYSRGRIAVWKSGWTEKSLRPRVASVTWSTIGEDSALVTVKGRNLFSGTEVLLGDMVIGEKSGLTLKSDKTMEFITSLRALATQDGQLSGRFGASVDLTTSGADKGISLNQAGVSPRLGRQLVELSVVLQDRGGGDLEVDQVFQPLLAIDGIPLTGPYDIQPTRCCVVNFLGTNTTRQSVGSRARVNRCEGGAKTKTKKKRSCDDGRPEKKCVKIKTAVPTAVLKKDTLVSVRVPLLGSNWSSSRIMTYQRTDFRLERLGGEERVTLAIQGWAFGPEWRVLLDKEYSPVYEPASGGSAPDVEVVMVSKKLLLVHAKAELLARFAKLGVKNPATEAVMTLAIPGFKIPIPKAALDPAGQVVGVTKDSAVAVVFKGKNLGKVTKVYFGGKELRFAKKAKEMTIFLTRKVTEKVGDVDLLVEVGEGSAFVAKVKVMADQ